MTVIQALWFSPVFDVKLCYIRNNEKLQLFGEKKKVIERSFASSVHCNEHVSQSKFLMSFFRNSAVLCTDIIPSWYFIYLMYSTVI